MLNKLKKFVKPSGHDKIQKMIASLKQFDEAMSKNDMRKLKSLYLIAARSLMNLKPYITNEKVAAANSEMSKDCEKMAKNLKNGASLKDVAKYEKEHVQKLIAALE